jgi:hypothetical protein
VASGAARRASRAVYSGHFGSNSSSSISGGGGTGGGIVDTARIPGNALNRLR